MKFRFLILFGAFIVCTMALIGRLFFWQIIKSKELSEAARYQHTASEKVRAPRGSIIASDKSPLATSASSWLLFIQKPDIKDSPKNIANKLAPFTLDTQSDDPEYKAQLLGEVSRIESMLVRNGGVWIPIKHKVAGNIKKNIEALKILGVGFEEEESRYYPEGSSSAHLLGFVGKDDGGSDKGYFGLEGFYDLTLTGKPGFVSQESDARGIPIFIGDTKEVSALSGVDLVTHIDKRIQLIAEEKLKKGLEAYGASEGLVIVIRPSDGAIMALAAIPSYDPFKYYDFGNEFFRNPSISNSFEPGSIFKPLVMAAGLDAGVIEPDTKCDICGGPVKVDKYSIETWDNKYRENATMQDIIVNSDNVGMTFIGGKLGADKLYDYLDKFGLGKLTEIDLQGEASPSLRKKGKWSIVDLATTTFGQGIAVTPIQIVKAFTAIANDGIVVTPQVVDRIIGQGFENDIIPKTSERVLSTEAAEQTTNMMVAAVKNGEAKWTQSKGFRVAGKTGTAQIPIGGHYDAEKTIASFIGFAPADDPKFLMLVTLREPQSSQWASETAAPLWFNIAKELFPYLGIQPEG